MSTNRNVNRFQMDEVADSDVYQKLDFDDEVELSSTEEKTPVLKRRFGFVPIIAFNLLILCTWQGDLVLLGVTLKNGGPAGTIYSFLVVWIGNLATFTSLAELASMIPTAGGQYHWVSILASPSSQKALSYVTGWVTVAGWQALVAASSYVAGSLLQGLIELVQPTYEPQLWHITLLTYGVLTLAVLASTSAGKYVPRIEVVLLIVYIMGYFAIISTLVSLGPHGSVQRVFTKFLNKGGWSTQGLSFFVGMSGNAYALLGCDSVYYMSEEIHNAEITVPRSMFWSTFSTGFIGLTMYITILFCMGNIDNALNSGFKFPFMEVLLQATNSALGTAIIVGFQIIISLGLLIGGVTASSRMLWSFARDKGVPFWRHIEKVDRRTSIPLRSILVTASITFLLDLISAVSPVAFNDVISLTVSSLYASYLVACSLLLWRRCQGVIRTSSEIRSIHYPNQDKYKSNVGVGLIWGPWKVCEPFGTVINAFACLYLLVIFFFSFWPPSTPVTPSTMNYSCLVMGFVATLSALYYVFQARKTYTGPAVDMSRSP